MEKKPYLHPIEKEWRYSSTKILKYLKIVFVKYTWLSFITATNNIFSYFEVIITQLLQLILAAAVKRFQQKLLHIKLQLFPSALSYCCVTFYKHDLLNKPVKSIKLN